ncbi:hypothetical protein [Vibrio vulnificus]|uniref:hypothetical protein n=1 Tax=Vibrio vulnificus TaxID=672 RepID=UPI0032EAF311
MTWITLPSVSVQNGSKIVTVNNTQTTNIKVGDALLIGNYQPVEIAGVFATQLSLRANWSNAAQANASAVVLPTFGDFNAATQALRQATQVTQGNFKTLEDWGTKLGNITFEGQDNSKHTARTLLQMDADVSELEEQANNLIVSLSGRNFALSKAILDALRSGNKEQYAASGFVHMGNHFKNNSVYPSINEGMWSDTQQPHALFLGINADHASAGGTSETAFAKMHVAGFVSSLSYINYSANARALIKFPDAPNGTVVYDSTGNCRGTGKPTLDLSKEVDPKYGDVASSVNEAVARAFEGELGNGDFRNGLTGWAFANGMEIIPNHSAGVTRFNIKTAGNGQCNNDTANNRLVRGLKYKATIYVADSSGTFFLSTLKDSAIDQQHALKNGWNEIEFTMGDSLYPVRKSNAQAGQYIDIGFFSVTALTEEVVIERVDMAGLEFFKEKVGAYLYPYGMIQSKATTVDGVATTEDTVRPITYFAVFEGDTTSRGRGWKLADLTFVQLATIMSNPEHNAWYNEAGELMQFRCRQRTVAGLGNGDWRVANPKGDILSFGTENLTRVAAQGGLDNPAGTSSGGNFFAGYTFTGHNKKPEVGMFTVSSNSGEYQAPDGECYFYVLATVPRLNQGAYHQSFNPMGTGRIWVTKDSVGYWYQQASSLNSKLDGFRFRNWTSDGSHVGYPSSTGNKPDGNIAKGFSGRPDGRFFDAIYADGFGGVIDWRLPARDMSGKEEAAKVFQKVVNGTYRGLELVTKTVVNNTTLIQNSFDATILGKPARLYRTAITITQAGLLNPGSNVNINGIKRCAMTFNGTTYIGGIHSGNGVNLDFVWFKEDGAIPPVANGNSIITIFTGESNISVSGEFTTLDVVASPEKIIVNLDLANGWMGRWIPVLPTGVSTAFPLSRKSLISSFTRQHRDGGTAGAWVSVTGAIHAKTNAHQSGLLADGVMLLNYTAFAKQTKNSTNKPVLNGSDGLGDVIADSVYHTQHGALLVESLIGKVPTNDRAPELTYLTLTKRMVNPSGAMNDASVHLPKHEPVDITAPTNNSPAVKALWCQASNNQQATLNFLWNEMVFDTNWRTPDKVWSGGSVSVAAGETFRAESSSAYAVAGLLMRCVKAVTANASVLGAMHVLVDGDVISLSDGQTYFKVVNNGWGDDSRIRIIDGVGTFNNENGDTCLYGISELAMPYGYTKNQAGAGKQVVGVDL